MKEIFIFISIWSLSLIFPSPSLSLSHSLQTPFITQNIKLKSWLCKLRNINLIPPERWILNVFLQFCLRLPGDCLISFVPENLNVHSRGLKMNKKTFRVVENVPGGCAWKLCLFVMQIAGEVLFISSLSSLASCRMNVIIMLEVTMRTF